MAYQIIFKNISPSYSVSLLAYSSYRYLSEYKRLDNNAQYNTTIEFNRRCCEKSGQKELNWRIQVVYSGVHHNSKPKDYQFSKKASSILHHIISLQIKGIIHFKRFVETKKQVTPKCHYF